VHNYRGQDNMGFVVEVIDPDPASPSVLEGYIFLHQSRPSPSAFGVTLSIEVRGTDGHMSLQSSKKQ
jgi:hypothetical protein